MHLDVGIPPPGDTGACRRRRHKHGSRGRSAGQAASAWTLSSVQRRQMEGSPTALLLNGQLLAL